MGIDNFKILAMKSLTLNPISEPALSIKIGSSDCLTAQRIISGMKKDIVELQIRMTIAGIALRNYKNPLKSLRTLTSLDSLRRKILGPDKIRKLAEVDGKYYWDLYTPGWPSLKFEACMEAEMNRIFPMQKPTNRFTNVFLAITKKCPLQCEHCFEWNALNGREKLTLQDIKHMVAKFQKLGTGQIQITGGEPMLRIGDILEILQGTNDKSDFWILTSGYNMTEENAIKLKSAGVTGVVVSLDHFDPDKHNLFRGFKHSFEWVQRAVKSSIKARLITALSICVTKEFVTESNLIAYANLARKMGVSFIQILEPRAVGHYAGQNVSLEGNQEALLNAFFLKMNYDQAFAAYPIVCYHGYYQRRIGCFASGNRNLYIDTDGDMHACPFCQTKMGSALGNDFENSIEQMLSRACHSFKTFSD